jgi:hypothetical protein
VGAVKCTRSEDSAQREAERAQPELWDIAGLN